MASIYNARFEPRFLDMMKSKTKLIDISRICLYIEIVPKDPKNKNRTNQKENINE